MYAEDSFFALTQNGRIGLAVLSVALCVLMILLTRVFTHGWPWIVRLMLSLVLLWLFIWLSPQIFFTYVQLFFSGQEPQWVIGVPPPLGLTLRVISFTGPADLIHHGQGALGILMVFAALSQKNRDPDD